MKSIIDNVIEKISKKHQYDDKISILKEHFKKNIQLAEKEIKDLENFSLENSIEDYFQGELGYGDVINRSISTPNRIKEYNLRIQTLVIAYNRTFGEDYYAIIGNKTNTCNTTENKSPFREDEDLQAFRNQVHKEFGFTPAKPIVRQ